MVNPAHHMRPQALRLETGSPSVVARGSLAPTATVDRPLSSRHRGIHRPVGPSFAVWLLLLGLPTAAACVRDHSVGLDLTIPADVGAAEARSLAYELRIYRDGRCPAVGEITVESESSPGILYVQRFSHGTAQAVGQLAEGRYGMAVLGRDERCNPVVYGCEPTTIGDGGRIRVALARVATTDYPSPICGPQRRCDEGRCVGGAEPPMDGGVRDAPVVVTDAGHDGGDDAGPPCETCDCFGREMDCQGRSGCDWFSCVAECHPAGTNPSDICDGCIQVPDVTACDAPTVTPYCAWYGCQSLCLPRGTDVPGVCTDCAGRTRGECSGPCSYYDCASRCLPTGIAQDDLCGTGLPREACSAYGAEARCSRQSPRCAWLACRDGCVPGLADPIAACACMNHGTVGACSADTANACAWYGDCDVCLTTGLNVADVCGG